MLHPFKKIGERRDMLHPFKKIKELEEKLPNCKEA